MGLKVGLNVPEKSHSVILMGHNDTVQAISHLNHGVQPLSAVKTWSQVTVVYWQEKVRRSLACLLSSSLGLRPRATAFLALLAAVSSTCWPILALVVLRESCCAQARLRRLSKVAPPPCSHCLPSSLAKFANFPAY